MSSSEGSERSRSVNRLIHELAETRRTATDEEILAIREYVANVGFNPVSTVRAGARIAGLMWDGRSVRRHDYLHNGPIHYLKHVVKDREWPVNTTYDQYIENLFDVVREPRGGIVFDYELAIRPC